MQMEKGEKAYRVQQGDMSRTIKWTEFMFLEMVGIYLFCSNELQ